MATLRLKPTSYFAPTPTVGTIQNPGSVINGLNPEDASSANTYAAIQSGKRDSYSSTDQNYIHIYFDIPNDISIKKITVKARIATYNSSNKGGYIKIPLGSNTTGKLEGQYYQWSSPSYAQDYMAGGTSNYSQYEVGESYLPYFIETVTNNGLYFYSGEIVAPITYISGIVLDVECVDVIKIGENKLDEAYLGEGWISKIYKGAMLLFEKEKPLIPRAYKQLKYIQGTGTQYIDTGIKMNSSVDIEADAEIRQFAWHRTNASTDLAGIFGNIVCGDSGGNRAGLRFYTERNYYWYYSNTGWPTVWPSDETFYNRNIYKTVGNVFYINGTSTITGTAGTWSDATNNALLFSMGESPKAGMKLFRAKLWDNNVLVRDMYPVKRKSDNAVGLYDVVSKTFFGNAGTGNFYESIPDEYQEVEYIQSNGTGQNTGQHIDTGYYPTNGDDFRLNMTVMPLDVPATEREFLAEYGGGINVQIGFLNKSTWTFKDDETLYRYVTASSTNVTPSNAKNKKVYIDGQQTFSGTSRFSLYLFAQNESNTSSTVWDSSIRLYACTITVNGVPIRNYVPCYRKSDGVIGLYDTINKQFKINEGSGSFTKGPDV